jgi:hypothetical protein
MKKNSLILIALFAILGGASYYFIKKGDGKTTLVAPDQDFAVPADQVGKIFLADKQNHQVTLTLQGKQWMVDGKYKVKHDVIENCLKVISEVKVKYVPSAAAAKNAITEFATFGIKVEVYGKSDNRLKTYYIGGTDNEGSGSYYIMENQEKPYVAHVPFFYGELQPNFPLKLEDWRDRTIFAEEIEDIQSASVEYPAQKSSSFKIENQGNSLDVMPFYAGVPRNTGNQKKGVAENFLFGFKSIVAEAFENTNAARDSIIRQEPFSVISLKSKKGEENALRIYPIYKRDASGTLLREAQVDRYYGYSSKGDFYLIQDVVFRKLFWDYNSFFSK